MKTCIEGFRDAIDLVKMLLARHGLLSKNVQEDIRDIRIAMQEKIVEGLKADLELFSSRLLSAASIFSFALRESFALDADQPYSCSKL